MAEAIGASAEVLAMTNRAKHKDQAVAAFFNLTHGAEQILDSALPVWRGLGRKIFVLAEDYSDLIGIRVLPPCPAIWVIGGENKALAFFANEPKVRPSMFVELGEMPVDEMYEIARMIEASDYTPTVVGPQYHNRDKSPVDMVAYYSVYASPKAYRRILDRYAFSLMGNEYLLDVGNERFMISVTPEERRYWYENLWAK